MKRYPFSLKKYAHEIEFYSNRLFNLAHDLEISGQKRSEMYNKLITRREKVQEVMRACIDFRQGNVAWLTGEQYGLAMFCVSWAEEERARANHN